MAKLSVEVVTGERVVFQEQDVDMVIVPGADGELGILPRHAPLVTLLSLGEMRIKKDGREDSLVVFGGFLEVANNHIRILADTAERAEEIDVARAEEARQAAERDRSRQGAESDLAAAAMALRRSAIRLKVGQRRRGRGGMTPPES